MVLNTNKPGKSLNNKSVSLSYHFERKYVDNDVVKILKIYIKGKYVDPFTKVLVSN